MMKKTLLILVAILLSFSACHKTSQSSAGDGKTFSISQLGFDFSIERVGETKGVRTGWLNGDKVFIFFEGINSAYLTVTFDGASWSPDPEVPSGMSEPSLAANGHLTAVYLPYGNDLTPSWDGTNQVWSFTGTNDYYYLKSENVDYFITDIDNVLPTLGAFIYMDTAEDFVQLFLPDESASGTIQLACNVIAPAGIAGVALDGTVTETSSELGEWITARAETIDSEKGYYASGKLSSRPGLQYYLAINAAGTYKHYYKQRLATMEGRGAYQLPPAEDWLTVSPTIFVEVAGNSWCSVNAGAANPWGLGTQYPSSSMGDALATDTIIPSDVEWNLLLDRTKTAWIHLSLLGTDGFLVMDREEQNNYFFLPCYNYWSTSSPAGIQHYLKTDADGTHEIAVTDAPANAYVRLLSSLYQGGFNPPEDGGTI